MKFILTLASLLLFSIVSLSQKPLFPKWRKSEVYFQTSLMSEYDNVKKKFGEYKEKQVTIRVEDADTDSPIFTVETFEKVLIEKGSLFSFNMERGSDGVDKCYYTVTSDKTMVILLFTFGNQNAVEPSEILLSYTPDISSKTSKAIKYSLK